MHLPQTRFYSAPLLNKIQQSHRLFNLRFLPLSSLVPPRRDALIHVNSHKVIKITTYLEPSLKSLKCMPLGPATTRAKVPWPFRWYTHSKLSVRQVSRQISIFTRGNITWSRRALRSSIQSTSISKSITLEASTIWATFLRRF